MNVIRAGFSVFLLAIIVSALLGWHWSVALPADKMTGARFVLGFMGVSAVAALVVIWKSKPAKLR